MPLIRKRRAPAPAESEASESGNEETQVRSQQRGQRRRQSPASDNEAYADNANGEAAQGDGGSQEQMVKRMIRMALACEYARIPIRRADIGTKVLGTNGRQFKAVFDEAQLQLKYRFGMQMTELPVKEKVTLQQRRAAQKSDNTSNKSNAWILTSTLPPKYRTPGILLPPKVPTSTVESTYIAVYTFVISCISLAGGSLPEAKLERYLKRCNANESTPIEKTDKLLARMVKELYIVKVTDRSGDEQTVDYMVGPRGKVEVDKEAVAGLVRTVYGSAATDDLEKRLERTLELAEGDWGRVANGNAGNGATDRLKKGRGRPRRQIQEAAEQQEESDDE